MRCAGILVSGELSSLTLEPVPIWTVTGQIQALTGFKARGNRYRYPLNCSFGWSHSRSGRFLQMKNLLSLIGIEKKKNPTTLRS